MGRIVAGAIGCICAIWRMPYDPIWSLTYIAAGAPVICALAAYEGEVETGPHGGRRAAW